MKLLAQLQRLSVDRAWNGRQRASEPNFVARLPHELLSDIFLQCLLPVEVTRRDLFSDDSRSRAKRKSWISTKEAPLNVSHVSRYWRRVALGNARMWSVICFQGSVRQRGADAEHHAISVFLERSSTSPLDILVLLRTPFDLHILDCSDMINPFRSLNLLMQQKYRWRGVHLMFTRSKLLEPILKIIDTGDIAVKELYIDCCTFQDGDSSSPSFPFMPKLPQLTMIKFSSSDNHSFRQWSALCPLLREIHISCTTRLLGVHSWLDNCPTLEVAAFSNVALTDPVDPISVSAGPQTRHMKYLTKLHLHFVRCDVDIDIASRAINATIESLQLPVVRDLSLSISGKPFGSLIPVIALLSATKPPLTSLRLGGFSWESAVDQQLQEVHLLHLLTPHLRVLSVDHWLTMALVKLTVSNQALIAPESFWPELESLHADGYEWILTRLVQFVWSRSDVRRGDDALGPHAIKQLVLRISGEEQARQLDRMLRRDPRIIKLVKAGFRFEFVQD